MTLARAVINPRQPETTLLAAGYNLTAPIIARLHELGVYDFWVRYPGLDFLDDLFSPQLSIQQQRLCETLKTCFTTQATRTDAKLPVHEYRDIVSGLVESIMTNASHMAFMSELTGVDDTLLRHSAEVTYLAVCLGVKLEAYLIEQRKRLVGTRAKDVINLGIGCMLHDLGELKVPEQHRESRQPWHDLHALTGDEAGAWREHAKLGYHAVHHQVEPAAAAVVLNHHQHFDGSGFPAFASHGGAQVGTQIHVFARIAAAADTFQHLLRPEGIVLPSVAALWRIQQAPYKDWLDPVVLQALLAVVPPFLPGMVVELTDGRQAVVTRNFPGAPCYPEVQILGSLDALALPGEGTEDPLRETIDLSQTPSLAIGSVDGVPVGGYLYGARLRTAEKAVA